MAHKCGSKLAIFCEINYYLKKSMQEIEMKPTLLKFLF